MTSKENDRRKAVVDKMKSGVRAEGGDDVDEGKKGKKANLSTEEMLHTAIRISNESNTTGEQSLASLATQGDTLRRSNAKAEEAHGRLMESKRTIRDIKHAICKEKVIKAAILVSLVLINCCIIYVRWLKPSPKQHSNN